MVLTVAGILEEKLCGSMPAAFKFIFYTLTAKLTISNIYSSHVSQGTLPQANGEELLKIKYHPSSQCSTHF